MSKALVLAEKPSVGRDIARVLNCNQGSDGFKEGSRYVVTWALGHLVTLSDPEAYDQKYQTWRLEDLPILPPKMKLQVIPQTKKQFYTVKRLLERKDIDEVIIATDAGREGELVARWILDLIRVNKPLKRLWISSVTDKAIREGFDKLKDGKHYLSLYHSAQARSIADWLVGINATRALTTKHNAQLSCGRVQTPTLHLVAMREDEIRNFKPRTYYGLMAHTNKLNFTWEDQKHQKNTFNEGVIDRLINSLSGQKLIIKDIKKQNKKVPAPQLYDLTELQREANRRYNLSAKETLNVMQSLYERHKVLTYPRTDSRYLSSDIVPTIKERLEAVRQSNNQATIAQILRDGIQARPHFVDDRKVSDHHAIIPTEERPNFVKFNHNERLIYDLVVDRFIAILLPPYTFEAVTITAQIGQETFKATGKNILSMGWKAVYQDVNEDSEDEQVLPVLSMNETLTVSQLKKTEGETRPPAYFTEGTLLSAMENPRPFMKTTDQKLIQTIGETGGLGTVATRADIIEKLFNTGLIEKRGNSIFTTSKGKQLLELVPVTMKSPELTAKWEYQLGKIEQNALDKEQFLKNITEFAIQNVVEIKNSDAKFKHDNLSGKPCPDCGKPLLEVSRKDRQLLVCQDRSCGYRKTLSQQTNARCPNCHKKLDLVGDGDNKLFICKCGFKEKLSTFQKRKEEEKKNLSTREARRILEKENKKNDVPINNALFDALKDFQVKDKNKK